MWIETEKGCVITCSNCGQRLELCYPDGTEVRSLPYCPYCGEKGLNLFKVTLIKERTLTIKAENIEKAKDIAISGGGDNEFLWEGPVDRIEAAPFVNYKQDKPTIYLSVHKP